MAHPIAQTHGTLEEIFSDVFFVTGSFRFAPGMSITRNMRVLREGKELTLVNSVRLSEAGEAQLAKLGKVAHVVRLGGFHGLDDPYMRERYGAQMWAPAGITHQAGIDYRALAPGASPVADATPFLFSSGKHPEGALIVARDGGILVTCDAYQNWTTFEGASLIGRLMLRAMRFGPALIGGPWAKRMGPGVRADFDRLMTQDWQHLLSGHGTPLRNAARDRLPAAVKHRFGS